MKDEKIEDLKSDIENIDKIRDLEKKLFEERKVSQNCAEDKIKGKILRIRNSGMK